MMMMMVKEPQQYTNCFILTQFSLETHFNGTYFCKQSLKSIFKTPYIVFPLAYTRATNFKYLTLVVQESMSSSSMKTKTKKREKQDTHKKTTSFFYPFSHILSFVFSVAIRVLLFKRHTTNNLISNKSLFYKSVYIIYIYIRRTIICNNSTIFFFNASEP